MIKVKYKNICLLNFLIFFIVIVSYILFNRNSLFGYYIFPVICFFSILFILIHYREYYGAIINFHSIIIISLYMFFMSRQITYLFGFKSYFSIYGDFSLSQYLSAYLFSYCSIFFFYAGSIINFKYDKEICITDDKCNKIYKLSKIIFFICLLPMCWYYYRLISVSLIYKYGSREFDLYTSNTGYLINIFRQWGVQSLISIYTLHSLSKKNKINNFFVGFYFIIIGISLMCGSRTEGIGLLLISIILFTEKNKNNKVKKKLSLVLAIFLMILIPYFYQVRKDITKIAQINLFDMVNSESVIKAIHEMGGSEAPLLIVQNTNEQLGYGKSYCLAILNSIVNFLPSTIRPSFEYIGPISLANYYSRKLNLGYGLGFSLAAEAYYNFNWLGIFVFLFFGMAFNNFFGKKNSIINYLLKILLAFLLFTMARRESKDLITSILYFFMPYYIVYKFFIKGDYINENRN